MLPQKADSENSTFHPITFLEAQNILSEIVALTNQPSIGLDTLQPIQDDMDIYLQELKASSLSYESEDAWLKVCNVYMLAYYRVMLRVSELLERKSA